MSESKDPIKDALARVIADQILASLAGPKREELLIDGIKGAVEDLNIKYRLLAAVEKRAELLIEKLLASGDYDAKITAAIEAGFASLIKDMPKAVRAAFLESLSGTATGSYDRGGILLKHLKGG